MEYSFDFAERMLDSAKFLGQNFDGQNETARTVVYQCSVSIEVSMKCLLEHAGQHPNQIRKYSHKLVDLLAEVDALKVNGYQQEPWDKLFGQAVDTRLINGSVGLLLHEANQGSTYPNDVRYGPQVTSIQPYLWLSIADVALDWCRANAGKLSYVPAQILSSNQA